MITDIMDIWLEKKARFKKQANIAKRFQMDTYISLS